MNKNIYKFKFIWYNNSVNKKGKKIKRKNLLRKNFIETFENLSPDILDRNKDSDEYNFEDDNDDCEEFDFKEENDL